MTDSDTELLMQILDRVDQKSVATPMLRNVFLRSPFFRVSFQGITVQVGVMCRPTTVAMIVTGSR